MSVRFEGTQITDEGLVHLKGLSKLQLLDLDGTQVTDAGLVHLKGLTKLEHLYLEGCRDITDAGLMHLKGLTNLEQLPVDGTKVHRRRNRGTDEGTANVNISASAATIRTCAACSTTRRRPMSRLSKLLMPVRFAALDKLGVYIERNKDDEVVSVHFGGTQVTDAGLVLLGGLSKLQKLFLDSTQVTDAGLVHLKELTTLTHLRLGSKVTDAGLVHFKGLTELQSLNLFGCDQLTDAGLVHLKG